MRSGSVFLALAAAALLATALFAQAPEVSSQDAPASFQSKVNLVLVPVVVRDRDGRTVGSLRQEDFQLFDKGKLQTIAKFSIETAAGRAAQAAQAPAASPLPGDRSFDPGPAGLIPDRFVAYLFDDVHIAFGDLALVRDAAWKHLQSSLKPADRAAIYTTSGQTALDFTEDRDQLRQTLLRLQPRPIARPTSQECPDISYYVADLIQNRHDRIALNAATQETMNCMQMDPAMIDAARQMAQSAASRILSSGDHESHVALTALNDVVRRLTAAPGQRTLVLVSPGFIRLNDLLQDETAIIDRAIRGNVTISALDARGLYTDSQDISKRTLSVAVMNIKQQYDREASRISADVMAELADGTGGTFFQNSNDLVGGFDKVAAAPDVFYVLGFSPQNLKLDGSYHVLKVSLKSPSGLNAKARRGYYAPRHLTSADDESKEEISQAMFSREELNGIPLDLHAQFFKSSDLEARLLVVAKLDVRNLHFRKADGRNSDELMVVSGIFDRNGNYLQGVSKKVDLRLKDDTLQSKLASGITIRADFKIAPGTYVIRLVARDAEGQMMAARNGAVEIP